MAPYFSQAHSSLRMFTERERKEEEEEKKNSNVCSMDDLGGASGSGGGLDSGSSGDCHSRAT